MSSSYLEQYLAEVAKIAKTIDRSPIEKVIAILQGVQKKKGRLFMLGVGGSAANASHAANDFRKIAHIESYAPTDNVAELTARVNDDGWDSVFARWLERNHVGTRDAVMFFFLYGGHTAKFANACILVPVVNPDNVTAHAESWQVVVWHAIVFHPKLKKAEGKWEAVEKTKKVLGIFLLLFLVFSYSNHITRKTS